MSQGLPPPLNRLNYQQLEDLCVDCGLCCKASIQIDEFKKAVIPELGCKYLVHKREGEHYCSVYNVRHDIAKGWCRPLNEAIQKGIFPDICPYVKDIEGYKGPEILPWGEYDVLRPLIKKALQREEKPEWASYEMWKSFTEDE